MDPVAPRIAGDVVENARSTLRDVVPWPFSILLDGVLGDRLAAVKHASSPNPYVTSPSGSQQAVAAAQARQNAIRGGFSGLAGSTAQWDHDQDQAPGLVVTGLRQDVTAMPLAPSRLIPWSVQHPRDANTTRGYTGPVITPGGLPWGWSTRFRFPRIISGTLLSPLARTPSPRDMAKGFVENNPTQLRVMDPFTATDDMEDWG
jgi:hypothetical protein